MLNSLALLKKNLSDSINAKQLLLEDEFIQTEFVNAAEMVLEKYLGGGRLYIMGNGGSAADAQHLAAEFVSKLAADREPLPAEALTVDTSILTAIGNDYGYEELFKSKPPDYTFKSPGEALQWIIKKELKNDWC